MSVQWSSYVCVVYKYMCVYIKKYALQSLKRNVDIHCLLYAIFQPFTFVYASQGPTNPDLSLPSTKMPQSWQGAPDNLTKEQALWSTRKSLHRSPPPLIRSSSVAPL